MTSKLNFIGLPEGGSLKKETFVYISYNKTKSYTFNVNYCNNVMNSFKVHRRKNCFRFCFAIFQCY